MDARRLAAIPPGVGLYVRDVKEVWRGADESGMETVVLSALQSLDCAGLVSITEGDDGWGRLTVPSDLHERLMSRWSAQEAARWHDRLLDNARALVPPGAGWWDLPTDAGYWWQHLVWHLRYSDPDAAAALVAQPRWQAARIRRLEVQGLLTDLTLVDSTESRAIASTINAVISGQAPGSIRDAPEQARRLLRALGLTAPAPSVPWPRSAVRAVLHVPPFTRDFALSPDGTWMVTAGKDGLIRVYDLETRTVSRVIHSPYDQLSHCAIAPDGSFFIAGTTGENVRAWDAATGEEKHSFRIGEAWRTVQSPSGTWIWYDMRTGTLGNVLTGWCAPTKPRTTRLTRMTLSGNGKTLAMANPSGEVSLWDPASGAQRAELPRQPHEIHRLGLADNGSWIALGDLHEIRVLELPGGHERFTLPGGGNTSSTRFATTDDWLAVPDKHRVHIRSTRDGTLLSTLDIHTHTILDCRLSPDRKHLMTLDNGDLLLVWDATALAP
ncbi:WD40 repeat domain-containing protein [Streptomyces sp. NPDC002779]|uniref:WD40 repeat domain-containing protein n=1 Tax=Streptomyces sp. NPDC002779 TaxID=3364664 RepID=UPI00369A93CE